MSLLDPIACFDDVQNALLHGDLVEAGLGRRDTLHELRGEALVFQTGRAKVAVVCADSEVPPVFDIVLVVGSSGELTSALERLKSRRVQTLTLPCTRDLLRRAVEEAMHAAAAFVQARVADQLLEIGLALNAERDPARLLELILQHAREITCADAGSIYVVENDDKTVRFKVAQNDSVAADFTEFTVPVTESSVVGTCVLSGLPVSLRDLYQEDGRVAFGRAFSHDRSFDLRFGYQTRSMLTVPMRPPGGKVLGVIQLINAKRSRAPLLGPDDVARRVVPFGPEDQQLCSALAAQAAVALENARLYAEIQALFEGFVRASVLAIEQRDPTTSGHSQRVADLTIELAKTTAERGDGALAGIRFTAEQLREIQYAGLLHDFGKVGVREQVLVKAKKLYEPQLRMVLGRFEHMRTSLRVRMLERALERTRSGGLVWNELEAEHARDLDELDRMLAIVLEANEPSILPQDISSQVREIGSRAFSDARGHEIRLLDDDEIDALLVRRGSLTANERDEIQNHVVHTYNFLMRIPWGQALAGVPHIAAKHHEYLDGTGYPGHIGSAGIPIQARMMTIADIYDALTASDRPYKRAVPTDLALDILHGEVKAGKIDRDLLDIFVHARVYERVPAGS